MNNYLDQVRKQYEDYPYPKRDPQDEKLRLMPTTLDVINVLNHFGFNGRIPLRGNEKFRVLVAGGGTGDAIIFLATALENFNVELVYLDMSQSSINIAKQRAEVRNLNNITWIQNSILNIPELEIGNFDYINCSGVLHHLESPSDGLKALKSVLKPKGIIGLMVYGQYGRTGIYQMQELMRLINHGEENQQVEVENAKKIIYNLPQSNWYKESRDFIGKEQLEDIDIYDILLHKQDRAYTVPELYNWVEDECDLRLIEFVGKGKENYIAYNPLLYIQDYELQEKVLLQSHINQKAIAELMSGNMHKHVFYVTYKSNENTIATIDDEELVPFFNELDRGFSKMCSDHMKANLNKVVNINLAENYVISIQATKTVQQIFQYMNGKNSIKDIKKKIKVNDKEFRTTFEHIFYRFAQYNLLLLKSKNTPYIYTALELQAQTEFK